MFVTKSTCIPVMGPVLHVFGMFEIFSRKNPGKNLSSLLPFSFAIEINEMKQNKTIRHPIAC